MYLGIRNVDSEKFIFYTLGNHPFPRSLMDRNHLKKKFSVNPEVIILPNRLYHWTNDPKFHFS